MTTIFLLLNRLQSTFFALFLEQDYRERPFYYEKKIHQCCRPLLLQPSVQPLFDLLLSIGSLRFRMEDHATFGVISPELKLISDALTECFTKLAKSESQTEACLLLKEAIHRLESMQERTLDLVAREPIHFTLFIQQLNKLEEILRKIKLDKNKIKSIFSWDTLISFVLPWRVQTVFRQYVVTLLKANQAYWESIIDYLSTPSEKIKEKRFFLETTLERFPNWVYRRGFNPRVSAGYRHFLVRLEMMSQILFSMDSVVREGLSLAQQKTILLDCKTCISQFMESILTVLNLEKLTEGIDDCHENSMQLEKIQDENNMEFIEQIKDLRMMLLKLADSLQ